MAYIDQYQDPEVVRQAKQTSSVIKNLALAIIPSLMEGSIIRYPGAKKSIASDIARTGVSVPGSVVEPFAGSAAASRILTESGVAGKPPVIGDINPRVIAIHKAIQQNPDRFIESVRRLSDPIRVINSQETGDYVRGLYKSGIASPAADTVIGNYSVSYNPPNQPLFTPGKYISKEGLLNRIKSHYGAIKNADIGARPWQETVSAAKQGDIVFLDPPYYNTKGYYGGKFNTMQQEELAKYIERLKGSNISGVVFNSPAGAEKFYKDLDLKWRNPYTTRQEVMGGWGVGEDIIDILNKKSGR